MCDPVGHIDCRDGVLYLGCFNLVTIYVQSHKIVVSPQNLYEHNLYKKMYYSGNIPNAFVYCLSSSWCISSLLHTA